MHGRWERASRVRSKRRPNKRQGRETKTSTRSHYYCRSRSSSVRRCRRSRLQRWQTRRERRGRLGGGERNKRERVLSWWEGQLGKVVAISFLGKSPDSCPVNARPPSSVKNRRDDKGQRRCVLKLASLSAPRSRGEVEAETSDKFCENFRNSGGKSGTLDKFIMVPCSARMVGEGKEFLTTPCVPRRCASCLSAARSASPDHSRIPSPRPFPLTSIVGNVPNVLL